MSMTEEQAAQFLDLQKRLYKKITVTEAIVITFASLAGLLILSSLVLAII